MPGHHLIGTGWRSLDVEKQLWFGATKWQWSFWKNWRSTGISKNDVKGELLEVKVGNLEKKIADLEKEVNTKKIKLDLFHTKYNDSAVFPNIYDNDAVYNDCLVAVKKKGNEDKENKETLSCNKDRKRQWVLMIMMMNWIDIKN